MKRTKEQRKQQTHDAILTVASRLIREKGIEELGVAEVMSSAGLTVGGFYSHFANKEDLVREAMSLAFRQMFESMAENVKGETGRERLQNIIDWYTSIEHRDCPAMGCAMPAIASDVTQEQYASLRAPLAQELGQYPREVARVVNDPDFDERGAVALLLMLLGSMVLARAVRGTPLSEKVLQVARETAADAAYSASAGTRP